MKDAPSLPPLKRFARLEMDGDPLPSPRPKKAAPPVSEVRPAAPVVAPDRNVEAARQIAADLTDNARLSMAQTTPAARRAQRAEQIRSRVTAPAPTAPMPRRSREWSPDDLEERVPGVYVMEVDLRARAREPARTMMPGASWEPTPGRFPRAAERPTPVELTPIAARQVMLMAWQAGVPGSALRILTAFTPGLGGPELEFAFEDEPQDGDLVVLSNGVRILVDPVSLEHVRGRRITWHDVPGHEGFAIR